MKQKKCKICKDVFNPQRPLQQVCSFGCSIEYTRKQKDKEWKQRKAQKKKELLTIQDYVKLAQQVFNKYIRLRDKGQKCISCQKEIKGVIHASHYISAGGHSNIRFHEDNVWASCYKCNVMLSGNQIEYRKRLVEKIGLARVEWLENNSHIVKHWSIEELKNIINIYKTLGNNKNKC